jgi:hypothetical protein
MPITRRLFIKSCYLSLGVTTLPAALSFSTNALAFVWPLRSVSRAALLRMVQSFVLRSLTREFAQLLADYAAESLIDAPPPWPESTEEAEFHNSFRSCWAFPETIISTQLGAQDRFVRVDNFCRSYTNQEHQEYADWNHVELARVDALRVEQNDSSIDPVPMSCRFPLEPEHFRRIEEYAAWAKDLAPLTSRVLQDRDTRFLYARYFVIPKVGLFRLFQTGVVFNNPSYGDNMIFV